MAGSPEMFFTGWASPDRSLSSASQVRLMLRAEPRDDWAARLDALHGTILWGQGHDAEAVSLLAPAVRTMEAEHTPASDLEPFKKALANAQQDSPAY
jgi:hypothetical protein